MREIGIKLTDDMSDDIKLVKEVMRGITSGIKIAIEHVGSSKTVQDFIEKCRVEVMDTDMLVIFNIVVENKMGISDDIIEIVKTYPCVNLKIGISSGDELQDVLKLEDAIKEKSEIFVYYTVGSIKNLFYTFSNLNNYGYNKFEFRIMELGEWGSDAVGVLCQQLAHVATKFITDLTFGKKLMIKNFHRDFNEFILFPKEMRDIEWEFKRKISLILAKQWWKWEIAGQTKKHGHIKDFIGVEDVSVIQGAKHER